MSEKITNATTIESTTATTVAKTVETTPSKKSSSTTTSKKGDTAMKSANKSTTAAATATTMTAQEFKTLWDNDPAAAFQAFIVGLSKLDDEGESAIATLQEEIQAIVPDYTVCITRDVDIAD